MMVYPTQPPSSIKAFDNAEKMVRQAKEEGIIPKIALFTVRASLDDKINPSYADIARHELPTISGYKTGGLELPEPAIVTNGNGSKFTTGKVSWYAYPGKIPAWRYACIYLNGILENRVDPLLCWFFGDRTPQDVRPTLEKDDLEIHCPSTGWVAW